MTRQSYDEIPPRVEYEPTDAANGLAPVFIHLYEWASVYDLDGESDVTDRERLKLGIFHYYRFCSRYTTTDSIVFNYRSESKQRDSSRLYIPVSRDDGRTQMTDAIRAEDVHVVYPDGTEAVDGVDMRVPEGEFFGFLGPNGAGKTTMIRTLVTLLRPTSGSITVNGYDVAEDPKSVRRSVGYMAQETSIDEELTARENVEYMAAAYGIPKSERTERADELLDLADLMDVADKSAKTFSGGMKKRLDAVTALVHRPPVVFLDEPTTGLDPKARNRLWEYFREINREGTTVFLTTQYLEEADQLCDRISLIKDGKIDLTGSPTELKREVGGDILELELAPSDVDVATRIVDDVFDDAVVTETTNGISVGSPTVRTHTPDYFVALREAGVEINGFDVRSPTLDDVFLAVTGEGVEEEEAVESDTEVVA